MRTPVQLFIGVGMSQSEVSNPATAKVVQVAVTDAYVMLTTAFSICRILGRWTNCWRRQ